MPRRRSLTLIGICCLLYCRVAVCSLIVNLDNELFEQTLRCGSQAALEIQPSTNDIDALMRSMTGPSMNITSSQPHMGVTVAPPPRGRREPARSVSGFTNGSWDNFGSPVEADQ